MVSFLFRTISTLSHKVALIDCNSGQIVVFSQRKSMVANISHGFINMGIGKGDVVMIFAPNSIQYPVTFLDIIATTVNTISDIKKQVNDCKPKLIVTVSELWDKTKDLNLPALILGSKADKNLVSKSKLVYFDD